MLLDDSFRYERPDGLLRFSVELGALLVNLGEDIDPVLVFDGSEKVMHVVDQPIGN